MQCVRCHKALVLDLSAAPQPSALQDMASALTFPQVAPELPGRYQPALREMGESYIVVGSSSSSSSSSSSAPSSSSLKARPDSTPATASATVSPTGVESKSPLPYSPSPSPSPSLSSSASSGFPASSAADPELGQVSTMGRQAAIATRVLEAAQDLTQVDQPVCERCATDVVGLLDRRRDQLMADRETFEALLSRLRATTRPAGPVPTASRPFGPEPATDSSSSASVASSSSSSSSSSEGAADAEAAEAAEVAALQAELATLAARRHALAVESCALETEARTLALAEQGFWTSYQDLQALTAEFAGAQGALADQHAAALRSLLALHRTAPALELFRVGHDGHLATISGFRLGRLPDRRVEWHEVNSALGQVALLLDTVRRRAGHKFAAYRLTPLGAHSRVTKTGAPHSLELFRYEASLGSLFRASAFDQALLGLLHCLKELVDLAATSDGFIAERQRKRPIDVAAGTIAGLSITYQVSRETEWTAALKYVLEFSFALLKWTAARP